jgi:hypothetical protein
MKMTWAWIGGFFEGEGCVTWYEGQKKGTSGRGAVITIGQKDKEPLNQIKRFLETQGFVAVRVYWRKPYNSKHNRGNGCWILQITRKGENQLFLRKVIPYLIAKQEKATQVLAKTLSQRAGRLHKTDEALILRLWNQQVHVREIARVFGIGQPRVYDVVRAHGKHTGRRCAQCTSSAMLPSHRARPGHAGEGMARAHVI